MNRDAAFIGSQLERMKYEIASELAPFGSITSPEQFRKITDEMKFEIAGQLGIPLQKGYNGDLTSREAGLIGGRIGGPIGGQMVRRMILAAQRSMNS